MFLFFFQSALDQTITFNTTLDSEKNVYQTEPKKLHVSIKKKIDYRKLLKITQKKKNFCSTLSEFENFLLCERILINVTTCQNETSS
jgi:hypothetical protein